MIAEPRCFTRGCKHFIGVSQPDGEETSERVICAAFEEQIPDDIAYGNNLHTVTLVGQGNKIVFESKT